MLIKEFYGYIKKKLHSRRRQIGKSLFYEALTKRKGLEQKETSLKVLALGSSQCARGFYADLIPDAYNLGNSSQDLYTSYYLLKKYLQKLENLEHVILFYAVFSPGYELAKTTQMKQVAVNHYVFDIPYLVHDLASWAKSVNRRLKKFDDTRIDYKKYCGFLPEDTANPMPLVERCTKHIRENQRPTHQTKYIEMMAELLKTRNIRFSIVVCPCRNDYTKFILNKVSDPFIELKNFLQNTDDGAVCFLDWTVWKDFEDADFADIDHLNSRGAKKFTLQLAQKLQLPIQIENG